MSKDKQFTALAHEVCPICGKESSVVLLHKRLQDISEMHNKVVGYLDPYECKQCGPNLKNGYIAAIIVEEDQTGEKKQPNRTGTIAFIREEAVVDVFEGMDELPQILEKRTFYLDISIARQIGLLPETSDQ